jgi:asparagine synthase (glutamine-hydrolysing)
VLEKSAVESEEIMSVQFGRWNFDGRPLEYPYLDKVRDAIAQGAPDGGDEYSGTGVSILYRAFHTMKESRGEIQPLTFSHGSVLTFDGRLDNRDELLKKLKNDLVDDFSDPGIVAAAYESRRNDSLSMLVGDWALAVWNPCDRSLVLAKDPIGLRPLYYWLTKDQVTWSSLLEPLIELAETGFALEEEYLAGWLSSFPAAHLTPYAGICSVPPSSFVRIRPGAKTTAKYWEFEPQEIRHTPDKECEEQFRAVFGESVRRRLRSDTPILAELSGGMDSSSIVCVADTMFANGRTDSAVETISYFDDSEPAWDERPYFTLVEQRRHRVGYHIDLSPIRMCGFGMRSSHFHATPGSQGRMAPITQKLQTHMDTHANRVILSGIGGDEFTGGVPTPVPELADLLVRGQFPALARQLKLWALAKRSPWFHLLWQALRPFVPFAIARVPKPNRPARWLERRFTKRHTKALFGYPQRLKFSRPLPSFQANLSTLDAMRRQIGCATSSTELACERRYPYLDRNFLEFIFATPRNQLTRPGERRSLMRRALRGVVPDAVLDRKRKAFVARNPRVTIANQWESLVAMNRDMISASRGIIAGFVSDRLDQKSAAVGAVPVGPSDWLNPPQFNFAVVRVQIG